MDLIHLAQDRDQWFKTVMNLLIPENVGKFLSSIPTIGFSIRNLSHVVSQSVVISVVLKTTAP
jgi:hypothetical protein